MMQLYWALRTYFEKCLRRDGVNAGTSDLRTMNSNIRIAVTQCYLGTWFVTGIYV